MKVLCWIIALLGLWEAGDIAALFVPGFGSIHAFIWNHIVVGVLLMIAGARASLTSHVPTARAMAWTAAIAGAWLIIASFILGSPFAGAGRWNDIIVGVIVLILGVWAALSGQQPHRR